MKTRKLLKTGMIATACFILSSARTQNVYDTYNPSVDSIITTYTGDDDYYGFTGEYQIFSNLLTSWGAGISTTRWITYKIEPVSFPFEPDCSNGDCGNSSSSTRDLVLVSNYQYGNFIYEHRLDTMSWYSTLLSNKFTSTAPPGGQRDFIPHTVLKHSFYLHYGTASNAPIIDSFSFVFDHTRGYMSEFPFRNDNGQSTPAQHDITIFPWFIRCSNDSFITIPPQSSNFMNTLDYYPFPDSNFFPNYMVPSWDQVPDPATSDIYNDPLYYTHLSPYSLVGVLLANSGWEPFAGLNTSQVLLPGAPHTYYIDTAMDLTTINPHERIIYNPTSVYITAADPVVFPSGYTFMTVQSAFPTAAQVAALDPDTMYADLREVPITGSALNLTDNPNTSAIDSLSYYYVTAGCTLRIKPCVTIYDATIVVQAGGRIELDTNNVGGNYVLQIDSGGVLSQQNSNPNVPCSYVCFESSHYNQRHVTISANTTWDTTNIESSFPGNSIWSAAANNTAKFVEGITIDSGATLTIGPGVSLLFGPNGKVIVKKGGRLLVNGTSADSCHFGPACQMEWQGIEVWGDPNATQQTTSGYTLQGFVNAEYCVIEHARNGIIAGCLDSSGAEGGVIDVDRCSFLNNVRDIVLLPYRNYAVNSVTTTARNRSQITRTAFRTTEYFFDPILNEVNSARPRAADAHISLYGVYFGTVQDCIFSTSNPSSYAPHLRGTGIYAMESGFYLRPQFPCTFENLSDGIVAQSSGVDTKVINIAGAIFTNSIHGIVLEGTRFSAIMKNEFDVPESEEFGYSAEELEKGYDKPVGVFIIGCVDYNIWENEFNVGDTSTQLTPVSNCDNCCYDIVVYNSVIPDSLQPYYGVGTGKIYKNKIHHASIGVQAQGDNGQALNPNGLEVMCNEFDELTSLDEGIIGTSSVSSQIRDQGVCNVLFPELQAANLYLRSCNSGVDETNITVNIFGNGFMYSDQLAMIPSCTSNVVGGFDCGNVSLSDTNSCPSHLSWGWYQPIIAVKYTTATTNHQDARHNLDSLVDDGSTEDMLNNIDRYENEVLYNILINASPWLSDKALVELLKNENREKLYEDQLVSILLQNGRLSETVYAAMLTSEPALTSENYLSLEENQSSIGDREFLEREWATWAFQADLAAVELVTHALINDSLDGAISILDSTTALPEMQKLFTLYLADLDTANAELVLIDIVNAQEGKVNSWSAMAWIALDHAQEGRSWLNATLEEYQLADSIWGSSTEKEIGARSVVSYYTRKRFAREPFGLESGARYGHTDEIGSTPMVMLPALSLYPNPATNTVIVVVSGNADAEMHVEVLNALGQKEDEIVITSSVPVEIDISEYAPGILYLRLTSQGIGLATEKLMIVR